MIHQNLMNVGCLLAAISVATSHSIFAAVSPAPTKSAGSGNPNMPPSKQSASPNAATAVCNREEEWESNAVTVVETAVEIYQTLATLIQRSPRSSRMYYDNFLYVAAWLLLSGLQGQMTHTSQTGSEKGTKEDKGKSPSKHKDGSRINLTKIQQGYGGLSVVLASQALATLEKLLEPNGMLETEETQPTPVGSAGFDVTENYTHSQRIFRLLSDLPLTQLLFHVATVSYRKSCNLKRIQKNGDGETVSLSDSATYYDDDDFSCSEESSAAEEEEDDDDSEPILGHWFEETITPPEPKNGKNKGGPHDPEDARNASKSCHRNLDISLSVPDKGEPHGYILLATQIFAFMNDHMLCSPRLRQYTINSLSEHQLILLSAIVKDLDRETARTETGTIAAFFGQTLGQLFSRFSQSLARYTHNLLAYELMSPSLQIALLSHLNVNPWSEEEDWPLLVHPRSLAVLAQVLLSKHRKDSKEESRQTSEAACLSIWRRLLETMIKYIEDPHVAGDRDRETEDLNVEHAQLLLFLFHSLQLMQKKAILLLCAQTLIRAAQAAFSIIPLHDTQLMLLAR
ncbi:protein purity of essence-like [Daphnia pulex]|uniref:protein purity of essence-like n=1 Tax=Daphnia pulex TaxID=6669 RepID=UPI001EE127B5|nr:protein purity of essence-like [Daphnia pulex]